MPTKNEVLEWLEEFRKAKFKGKGPEEASKYRLIGKIIRWIKES